MTGREPESTQAGGIPPEVLAAVRRIEIRTRRLVDEMFSGEYHSVFKGRGMEFREVREYDPGDDVRTIDWNVTARTGEPFVKIFEEERELTVMLVADLSRSMDTGSGERMKSRIAAELCGVLAFSAISNKDKVGLIISTDRVEKYIPPAKGKSHVLRLIRDVLAFRPSHHRTDLDAPLQMLGSVLKRKATVFLVSDFWAPAEEFSTSLRVISRRHDCIGLRVRDPLEQDLPAVGLVQWRDAETGRSLLVDTSDASLRRDLDVRRRRHDERLERMLQRLRVDLVDVDTTRSYVEPLMAFFLQRAQRKGRKR